MAEADPFALELAFGLVAATALAFTPELARLGADFAFLAVFDFAVETAEAGLTDFLPLAAAADFEAGRFAFALLAALAFFEAGFAADLTTGFFVFVVLDAAEVAVLVFATAVFFLAGALFLAPAVFADAADFLFAADLAFVLFSTLLTAAFNLFTALERAPLLAVFFAGVGAFFATCFLAAFLAGRFATGADFFPGLAFAIYVSNKFAIKNNN